jgi:hypothetical protein
LGLSALQELRAACKESYKAIARHHLVAADEATRCVQTAHQAAARSVRRAGKAEQEEVPLDFLARFLAFQQAMAEVAEVRGRLSVRCCSFAGRAASGWVWRLGSGVV